VMMTMMMTMMMIMMIWHDSSPHWRSTAGASGFRCRLSGDGAMRLGTDTVQVVVSAPVKDPNPVLNIVYGVNHVSCC
jgi:hypothetical protein